MVITIFISQKFPRKPLPISLKFNNLRLINGIFNNLINYESVKMIYEMSLFLPACVKMEMLDIAKPSSLRALQ